MEKEFIPYELAIALKELGFDEPCFAQYRKYDIGEATLDIGFSKNEIIMKFHNLSKFCSAPLYQQAFSFFREKYGLYADIYRNGVKFNGCIEDLITGNSKETVADNGVEFEEAELECLKKLIEIVKQK